MRLTSRIPTLRRIRQPGCPTDLCVHIYKPVAVQAYEKLPGRYWLVGYDEEDFNMPVFKQEQASDSDRVSWLHTLIAQWGSHSTRCKDRAYGLCRAHLVSPEPRCAINVFCRATEDAPNDLQLIMWKHATEGWYISEALHQTTDMHAEWATLLAAKHGLEAHLPHRATSIAPCANEVHVVGVSKPIALATRVRPCQHVGHDHVRLGEGRAVLLAEQVACALLVEESELALDDHATLGTNMGGSPRM